MVLIMGEEQIDRDSGVQPYRQLAGILRRQIQARAEGYRLPAEKALAAQYDVSPATVRKALDELRREGLVETVPGYGSRALAPEERGEPDP
jgi:DNA-binding GntR family transcriptional regulator